MKMNDLTSSFDIKLNEYDTHIWSNIEVLKAIILPEDANNEYSSQINSNNIVMTTNHLTNNRTSKRTLLPLVIRSKYFECELCCVVSNGSNAFKRHLKNEHMFEKPSGQIPSAALGFKCEKCNATVASSLSFFIHTQLHCQVNTNKCQKCGLVCNGLENFNNHLKTHRRIKATANTESDEVIAAKPLSNRIVNKEVSLFTQSTKRKTIKVKKNYSYIKFEPKTLRKRIEESKSEKTKLIEAELRKLANIELHKQINMNLKPYKCDLCAKGFNHIKDVKKHLELHSKDRPFKCRKCNYTFKKGHSLRSHMRSHTGVKPYKCDQCGVSFSQVNNLQRHKGVHSVDQPFKCDQCGTRYKQAAYLAEHMRVHTGERPYRCHICGMTFVHGDILVIHRKLHSGIRAYQCEYCDKAFYQAGSLHIHTRMHTGFKPFKCEICPKAFSTSSHLKRHITTHSKKKK